MKQNLGRSIVSILTSVRVAVVLFVLLTIVCVIATLLPQGQQAAYYAQTYGTVFAALIAFAGFDHAFSSPLFIVLSALFGVNLFSCTLLRLRRALRLHRLTAWGSPVLHLGLCLVLIGILVGLAWGQSGFYSVSEGESVQIAEGREPFGLQLDSFAVEFYEDGVTPRQFSSELVAIAADGTAEYLFSEVNHPAKYEGVKIYQMSYGWQFNVVLGDGENSAEPLTLTDNSDLALSDSVSLHLQFLPDAAIDADGFITENSHQPKNPHLLCTVSMAGQTVAVQPVAQGAEAELIPGVTLRFEDYAYYSGLQVKRDSGVAVIFAGFLLVLAGMTLRFLGPQQRTPKTTPVKED